jgi:glycosyltransferase involved in cell wall biosynthesis
MTSSLVTIGITCYNAADTIQRSVNSALAQDWPDTEILVVDDRSQDRSAAVVEKLLAGVPNARLVRHTINTGPAGARNTVFNEAKGEFIAFFDDDDQAFPERVRKQVQHLKAYEREANTTLVACYASGTRCYDNGYRINLAAVGSKGKAPHGPGMAEYLLLYRQRPGWFYGTGTPSCSMLARRSTFEILDGFDPRLRRVEDADFAIRLALKGGHFIGTPQALFIQYATHAVDKGPEQNLEAEQALAVKFRDYLRSIGQYYYALHWPRLRYCHFKKNYKGFLKEFLGLFIRYPLAVPRHFLATGPKRLIHERRMRVRHSR